MLNLMMPGNPRYQPKSLQPYFGYDYLYQPAVKVELAVMRTLGEMGVIPAADIALLTQEVVEKLLLISTTEVDKVEKEITKHDVRALVRLMMQEVLPEPLRRWVHIPLTSYDPLDTARSLQFVEAHSMVVRLHMRKAISDLADKTEEYASTVQIGRTHGQHALPITVGFWLATILNRLVSNAREMDRFASGLVGKISGAVGAHNAQVGLGLFANKNGELFENLVLAKLGLNRAFISTQILPPEPLAYYLFSVLMTLATLGQFGRDCRHLMRSEIGEIGEPFAKGQVGSSTMAQKRNPMTFENIEGTYLKSKAEFGKVLETLVSEHQRDLVGSSLMRDFPVMVINLVLQLETLLREDKGQSFIRRITVNEAALERNFALSDDTVLAEPLYIALQMAGYSGDAHEIINRHIVPAAIAGDCDLTSVIENHLEHQPKLAAAWANIPAQVKRLLRNPERYIGDAKEQALAVASSAREFVRS